MRRNYVVELTLLPLVVLQVSLAGITPTVSPNLVLAYCIVAGNYMNYRTLLWFGFTAGILLDLYGPPSSFGINLGVCLLAIIINKLVVNIEDQAQRLIFSILMIIAFSILTVLLQAALVVQTTATISLSILSYKTLIYILYNSVIGMTLYGVFEFSQRHTKSKAATVRG